MTLRHEGSLDTSPKVTDLAPFSQAMPQDLDLSCRCQVPASVREAGLQCGSRGRRAEHPVCWAPPP